MHLDQVLALLISAIIVQSVFSFSLGQKWRKTANCPCSEGNHFFLSSAALTLASQTHFHISYSLTALKASAESSNDGDDSDLQLRKDALELLDCITSPKDIDDPAYDVVKDMRRDDVLLNNDHSALKIELRARGLRQNGDKMEMIARLLLHIIDPTINYSQT